MMPTNRGESIPSLQPTAASALRLLAVPSSLRASGTAFTRALTTDLVSVRPGLAYERRSIERFADQPPLRL
jgi:hypothetical protein